MNGGEGGVVNRPGDDADTVREVVSVDQRQKVKFGREKGHEMELGRKNSTVQTMSRGPFLIGMQQILKK